MMNNESTYRICSLRAAIGGAHLLLQLEVTENGERSCESLALLSARLSRLPQVGEIDKDTLEELRREAAICAAIGAGLRSLGANGCSAKHLIQKLRMRGCDADVAAEAVAELSEKGYLREEEGALREAERGIAKLWGDRRILADLSAKGYTGAALKYAAARLRTEDGAARCAALMRKRRICAPVDEAEARKLFSSLTRYGYTPTEIREAMKRHFK